MLQSSNDITGGQRFTLRIEQLPDGSFRASTRNAPELEAVVRPTQLAAARAMNNKIQDFVAAGYKVAGK